MEQTALDGLFFIGGNWQGRIISKAEKNLYLAQLYEWTTGAPSCLKLIPIESMVDWSFYDTTAEWHKAGTGRLNERE